MNMQPSERGFTLMEVLVALVVCALLMAVLLDGTVSAKSRSQNLALQNEALLLADANIDALRFEVGEPSSTNGRRGDLSWIVQEDEIARDRRGNLVLVESVITIASEKNVELLVLRKRYLKKLLSS